MDFLTKLKHDFVGGTSHCQHTSATTTCTAKESKQQDRGCHQRKGEVAWPVALAGGFSTAVLESLGMTRAAERGAPS